MFWSKIGYRNSGVVLGLICHTPSLKSEAPLPLLEPLPFSLRMWQFSLGVQGCGLFALELLLWHINTISVLMCQSSSFNTININTISVLILAADIGSQKRTEIPASYRNLGGQRLADLAA